MTQPQHLKPQPTSLQDVASAVDSVLNDGASRRRPWMAPNVQALDLSTARASGCVSAHDNGSC
jgi:hypothetical protein